MQDDLREALELARHVRRMTRAENAHARGIQRDRKAGREDGSSTSRDDVDMIHADLYEAWPAKRLDALILALTRPSQVQPVDVEAREVIARAIAREIMSQDGYEDFSLKPDLKIEWLDQGEVDFGKVADAVLALTHSAARDGAPTEDKYRLMLLDLLATIHRDGGHKTQEIGIDLAWQQAIELSAKRIATSQPVQPGDVEAMREALRQIIIELGGVAQPGVSDEFLLLAVDEVRAFKAKASPRIVALEEAARVAESYSRGDQIQAHDAVRNATAKLIAVAIRNLAYRGEE